MLTKDKAFKKYEETLAKIDKQAIEAKEKARVALNEQLKALQISHHEALKAIRAIQQKTRRLRKK